MSVFSTKLKEIRISNNVTQKQLADFLGINERSYQNYEYGNREPNFDITVKLANYLEVSVDYLLGRTDNPEINK